jgi:hypothetical protein
MAGTRPQRTKKVGRYILKKDPKKIFKEFVCNIEIINARYA